LREKSKHRAYIFFGHGKSASAAARLPAAYGAYAACD
jgi:hypothetical protein